MPLLLPLESVAAWILPDQDRAVTIHGSSLSPGRGECPNAPMPR